MLELGALPNSPDSLLSSGTEGPLENTQDSASSPGLDSTYGASEFDMATALPMRPNTSSTGASSGSGSGTANRQPSLSSFASSEANYRSGSTSTHNDALSGSQNGFASSVPQSQQHTRRPSRPTHPSKQRQQKTLKPQYPADSIEKHVEYILVASFDIDRGSVMEHQYPAPVGGDEHMLAELMLPDQAHVRAQDWTIFFLHKDAAMEGNLEHRRKKRRRKTYTADGVNGGVEENKPEGEGSDDEYGDDDDDYGDDDDDDDDDDSDDSDEGELVSIDGPPLVYVLNLVNTKHDNTIRRGAIVKAMAICTRHPFLHIYKPLLLLALEQYFSHPALETLAQLYDAVNSMDLSLMPRLTVSEQALLRSSDAKDLFLEKFETMIAQKMTNKQQSYGDGAGLSPPSPSLGAKTRYGLPRDTHEFDTVVKYANVPVPVKIPTALSRETVGDFSLIKLITAFSTPHTASPVAFSPTHPHLTTSGPLTHPIIVLLNALLTQKRIIFLGHNLPSSEVADAVLAACSLASGNLLRGFTRHAFPYTDLTKIDDLLKVPGFIAGVTNPAFANKNEWWDLLCDLPTGRMRISNRIENAPFTEGIAFYQQTQIHPSSGGGGISALAHAGASLSAGLGGNAIPTGAAAADATGDAAFMANVLKAIEERHGENAVKGKFRRWTLRFTRLASAFEETVYGASALHIQAPTTTSPQIGVESPSIGTAGSPNLSKPPSLPELPAEITGHGYVWPSAQAKTLELAANATRIEGWRNTRSYYNFIQDLATLYVHRPVKELDLYHLHDKLAKLRLGAEQSGNIYLALCAAVNDDQEICQLLSVVANGSWDSKAGPTAQGQGLFYLSLGLFHAKQEVKEQVAELLLRIQEHEAGRHFWNGLGRFAKMAWHRIMSAKEAKLSRLDGEEGERHI